MRGNETVMYLEPHHNPGWLYLLEEQMDGRIKPGFEIKRIYVDVRRAVIAMPSLSIGA